MLPERVEYIFSQKRGYIRQPSIGPSIILAGARCYVLVVSAHGTKTSVIMGVSIEVRSWLGNARIPRRRDGSISGQQLSAIVGLSLSQRATEPGAISRDGRQ